MSPDVAPTGLPVEAVVPEVRAALAVPGAAVLVAPPGAGKTTVVPLRLLAEPWLGNGRIVVLEPRRLAARAAAQRMAALLGEDVGHTVGYRTRDAQVVGKRTRIEVVTEGILVRRIQGDPSLEGVGLVILDEVHERNLVTDLSLALLVDVRTGLRDDLRVVAMSATVHAERFAQLLGATSLPAPVIASDGRTFPVTVRHLPPGPRDRSDAHTARAVATALEQVPEGDVLAFLPGAADIRRVAERLRPVGALPANVDVHPLFGALGQEEQDAALAASPAGRRRVVLATDIAESSLTVDGVRVVVDVGSVRVPRLDPVSGMTRLQTEPASVASADQRAGRAGRVAPGVAYRLWDPADAGRRSPYAVPEIAVADLAGFVLEVATWGAAIDELPLIEQPPPSSVAAARTVLRSLGAIDDADRATARGRSMADLPVHPRLAALVLDGVERGAGWTGCLLAAVLEERDVLRGRPEERPVDIGLRVELVDGGRHPLADRAAVRSARRRAEQLGRRLQVKPGRVDLDLVGPLVASAYPERIAQAQGGGGFRLRGGGGGQVAQADPLARAELLAVAQVTPGPRGPEVALAAPIDRAEVDRIVRDDVTEAVELRWDGERDDLRERRVRRSGALVLSSSEGQATPGPETVDALLEHVRATEGAVLGWTPAVRDLQGRLGFLYQLDPDRWSNVSDPALLAGLDGWLAPFLVSATRRRDLERVDLRTALLASQPHDAHRMLDQLAPRSFAAADGRAIPITYDERGPRAAARAQQLFGLRVHPTVGGGSVPVVIELLSPAGRPIQVTADLPGFWAGSWAEVRKELAGRYPKHPWPTDPASSTPPAPRSRRG